MNARCTLALALALLLPSAGCKRQRAPLVEEIWDEAPTVQMNDALGSLAPPWPAPTRAVLESGLATFWLEETGAPVFHARLMIPTHETEAQAPSLAAATVVAEHIQQTLARRLATRGASVALDFGPDRFEVAVHGHVDDAAAVLDSLARALDPRTGAAPLERARAEAADRVTASGSDEAALAELVAKLLGRALDSQRMEPGSLRTLSADELAEAWRVLSDPRRAVLIVHAGSSADALKDALRNLSQRWHGMGRRELPPSAVSRLRATVPATSDDGRLLAAPAAAIDVAQSPHEGGPVLMLGRIIPTVTPQQRSLARLAQRIIAEELDARLVVSGPQALFVVRVNLSSRDPEGSAAEAVDILWSMARTRQPRQRLFAAAQLWLGARVVQASLNGEDWTALWAEAMDLAGSDDEITAALARDASTMLEPDAESLMKWQGQWLDPRGGEGGWSWTVAGADAPMLRRLGRIAPVTGQRSGAS